jgi:hypothetical protein
MHKLAKRRKLRAILSHRLHDFYEFLKAHFAGRADDFLHRAERTKLD